MKRFSSRGFTLMELLIALTLLGLVMTILYGALRIGIRSWEAGEQRAVAADDRRQVLGFLKRELSQVYPLIWQGQGKRRVAFTGGPNALQFAAILPAHRGVSGLYFISIKQAAGPKGRQLTFSYRLAQPGNQDLMTRDTGAKETRAVLVRALKQAEFSYYGRQGTSGGAGGSKAKRARWWAQWKDPNRLPSLIRLRIHSAGAFGQWPELVVPVYAEVHPGEPQLTMKLPGTSGASGAGDNDGDFSGDFDG